MPRTLSAAVLTAIAAKTLSLALFCEIAFADNTLYLWGGVGPITPPGPPSNPLSSFPYGQTFTGLGWLAKLSAIPQTTKVQAQNVTLSLSGIPSSLVAEATAQVRIAGTATVWLALFSAGALIEDPVQLFSGSLDVPSLTDGGDTSTISITCENSLLSLNLAPNRQFDDGDQQIYFPGDLGMSFVDKLANLNFIWPAPDPQGSPYPVYMSVTPNGADIAVGGTVQLFQTQHLSNGSNVTVPAGNTGSSTAHCASTNPRVATVDPATGIVTGVSPGVCSIIARSTTGASGVPFAMFRSACTVIVHS